MLVIKPLNAFRPQNTNLRALKTDWLTCVGGL
jgi:hypothetical protein